MIREQLHGYSLYLKLGWSLPSGAVPESVDNVLNSLSIFLTAHSVDNRPPPNVNIYTLADGYDKWVSDNVRFEEDETGSQACCSWKLTESTPHMAIGALWIGFHKEPSMTTIQGLCSRVEEFYVLGLSAKVLHVELYQDVLVQNTILNERYEPSKTNQTT